MIPSRNAEYYNEFIHFKSERKQTQTREKDPTLLASQES